MTTRGVAGNFTVSALLTTVIGVTFAMGGINLVRYVTATSTVEAAARKTIRCLTPTNGTCLTVTDEDRHAEWTLNRPAEGALTTVDTFDYQGTVFEQQWEASYTSYETTVADPVFTVRYQPLARFRAEPPTPRPVIYYQWDGYEHRLRPRNTTYPLFHEDYERSRENLSPSSWDAPGFRGDFLRGAHQTLRVRAGTMGEVSTGYITVPDVDEDLPCVASGGCRRYQKQGTGNWNTHAQLSFKVFARVRSANGRPAEVAFNRLGAEPAVEVTVRGHRYAKTSELGGRAPEAIGGSWEWYNLWLRGPDGAHGGDPSEPHAGIVVPRGGRFNITVRLTARKQPVDTEILILYYFDEYDKVRSPLTVSCAHPVLAPTGPALCPSRQQCGVPATLLDAQCREASRATKLLCSDGSAPPVVALGSRTTYVPLGEAPPSTPPLGYCGWQREGAGVTAKALRSTPSSPTPTSVVSLTLPCGTEPVSLACDGTPPPVTQCPTAQALLEESRRSVATAKLATPLSTHLISLEENDFQWHTPSLTPRTVKTLTPRGACSKSVISLASLKRLTRANGTPPSPQEFGTLFSPPPPLPVSITPVGAPVSRRIESVYPFSGTHEVELANTDKNGLCAPPRPLQDRLREYASQLYPELRDSTVQFEGRAIPTGSLPIAQTGGCSGERTVLGTVPRCTPTRTVTGVAERCSERLGIFSKRLLPAGPEQCRTVNGAVCTEVPAFETPSLVSSAPELAKQAGFRELQRAFPQTGLGCTEPGCATLNAELSSAGVAHVQVRYEMPLHFPLSTLLGRSSLPVERELREAGEIAFLRGTRSQTEDK